MPAFTPPRSRGFHGPVECSITWLDPRMGTLRTPAPPLSVVVSGRIVAQCTSPEAHEAAKRLLGVDGATRDNP